MEFEQIIKLIEAVSASDLTRFKYEAEGIQLHLAKEQTQARSSSQISCADAAEPEKKTPEEDRGNLVSSPLVGMFYAAPAEDAAPFVQVGDTVKKGQTLAIVEAMKLMNEIESEFDGTVAEILVNNGQPVEYGQPLFRISSAS